MSTKHAKQELASVIQRIIAVAAAAWDLQVNRAKLVIDESNKAQSPTPDFATPLR